jgi:hypothetical protein
VRNTGNNFRKGTTMATRNFVDHDTFKELIRATPRADGRAYEDIAAIYGDMSRLVVGWLATTDQRELAKLYNRFGWGGRANVRAIQAAAILWMDTYRPQPAACYEFVLKGRRHLAKPYHFKASGLPNVYLLNGAKIARDAD